MFLRSIRVSKSLYIFLAIAAFMVIAAVNSQANPLFFALGMIIGAIICSPLLAWSATRKIQVTRSINRPLYAGDSADFYYRIRNLRTHLPTLALSVCEAGPLAQSHPESRSWLPIVRGGQARTVHVRYPRLSRGRLALSAVQVDSSFPFGIFIVSHPYPAPDDLLILPRVGRLQRDLAVRLRLWGEEGDMISQRTGGTEEFFGLRDYRPGDPLRMIYWRRSARQGKLVVREMALSAPPKIGIALAAKRGQNHELYESAVEMTATLVCYYLDRGYAVGLTLPSGHSIAPALGAGHKNTLLQVLAVFDYSPDGTEPVVAKNINFTPVSVEKTLPVSIVIAPSLSDTVGMVTPAAFATVLTMDDPDHVNWVEFSDDRKDHNERQKSGSSGASESV